MDKQDRWFRDPITAHDIYHHAVTRVLEKRTTAYQQLLIVETPTHGKVLILDDRWQSAVSDEFLYHEPLVHVAGVCCGGPGKVLVLGGGEGAALREVLRWRCVQRAVMVDIDGQAVEACRQHLAEMHQGAFDDPRASLLITDAMDYLDAPDEQFDVVICDLSDPVEDGPSYRLFTREYFERARGALKAGGYLVIQAGSMAPMDMTLPARLAATLKAVFGHLAAYMSYVPSFVTPWGFLLASDEPIDTKPQVAVVDQMLADKMIDAGAGLRMFDGQTMLGLLQTPRYVREAIDAERRVSTLADPANVPLTG